MKVKGVMGIGKEMAPSSRMVIRDVKFRVTLLWREPVVRDLLLVWSWEKMSTLFSLVSYVLYHSSFLAIKCGSQIFPLWKLSLSNGSYHLDHGPLLIIWWQFAVFLSRESVHWHKCRWKMFILQNSGELKKSYDFGGAYGQVETRWYFPGTFMGQRRSYVINKRIGEDRMCDTNYMSKEGKQI